MKSCKHCRALVGRHEDEEGWLVRCCSSRVCVLSGIRVEASNGVLTLTWDMEWKQAFERDMCVACSLQACFGDFLFESNLHSIVNNVVLVEFSA